MNAWYNLIRQFITPSPDTFSEDFKIFEKYLEEKHPSLYTTVTSTANIPEVKSIIEKERQQKNLEKRIDRFSKRLKNFIETDHWVIKKDVSLKSNDDELQSVLQYLNREEITIEALRLKVYSTEELEKQPHKFKQDLEQVREKIRYELKMREAKKEKRKLTFIMEQ